MTDAFHRFAQDLAPFIADERIISDPLRTLAFGTDASFYRLIPKLVVTVINEQEVQKVLELAHQHKVHLTFRAAGTSLSGQAVTDGVLVRLGNGWNKAAVLNNGAVAGGAGGYWCPC